MTVSFLLDILLKYKGIPSYQFERRIDVFIMPYLEKAFNHLFSTETQPINDFILVYPEFPIRTIDKKSPDKDFRDNKSACYVDYLMWSRTLNLVLLVEFKTDHS